MDLLYPWLIILKFIVSLFPQKVEKQPPTESAMHLLESLRDQIKLNRTTRHSTYNFQLRDEDYVDVEKSDIYATIVRPKTPRISRKQTMKSPGETEDDVGLGLPKTTD